MSKWSDYKRLLKAILSPNAIYDSIEDIDLEGYYQQGFHTIYLDIDNTIIGLKTREISIQTKQWIDKAKAIGFNILIISNNISQFRIQRIAKQVNLNGLYFALKPLPFSGRLVGKQNKSKLNHTLMIGDQVLTDIIFGNWLGCFTILVEPVDKELPTIKKVQKHIETKLLNMIGLC